MYIIEDLKICVWAFLIFGRILLGKLIGERITNSLYYIDSSTPAELIQGVYLKKLKLNIEKLDFDFFTLRDDKGVSIGLRIELMDKLQLRNSIKKNIQFRTVVERENTNSYKRYFLEKQIINNDQFTADSLYRVQYLLQVASWKASSIGCGKVVFLMKNRPWKEEISNYAARHGVRIIWQGSLLDSRVNMMFKLLYRIILRIFKRLKSILNIRRIILSKKHSVNTFIADKKEFLGDLGSTCKPDHPCIAVPYYGNLNLDRPELNSDLFFWHRSGLSGNDILVMFEIPQVPFDTGEDLELRRHGINAVALNPKSTVVETLPIFCQAHHNTDRLKSRNRISLPTHRINSVEQVWIEKQRKVFDKRYAYWKEFFNNYNVKLYFNWYKYSAEHIIIADVLRHLGGISAVYQKSFQEFPWYDTTTVSDLSFNFSHHNVKIERVLGSIIPYHVVVGFIPDYRFPLLKKQAKEIRKRLLKNGATYILSYFDENSEEDGRWWQSHDLMRVNYEFLLQKVFSEPRLGVIFKPKKSSNLRERLGPTLRLLEEAEKTGRCLVLEGGTLKNQYPPAIASLASDVAIHGHLHAGTAGLESALAGIPTLLLDREGWPISKLYDLGKGKVVFNDWESLWDRCMDYWDFNSRSDGFGDWSPLLDELDPFRDGRAAERIGTYLKWLIDGFKAGLSRETVLSDAAQRYTKVWGSDKITSVNC